MTNPPEGSESLLDLRRGTTRLVVHAGVPQDLREHWLEDDIFRNASAVPGAGQRTDLALIETSLGPLVAKRFSSTGLRRLRQCFVPGRAERALHLGRLMRRRGVQTPEPLAWLSKGRGSEILVMRYVDGRGLLESAGPELWDALARAVARMHNAGFRHRDLKAPNVLVTGQQGDLTCWLLDLDGARKSQAPPPRRIVVRDLGRIAASLLSSRAQDLGLGPEQARHLCSLLRPRVGLPSTDESFADDVLAWAMAKRDRNQRHARPLS